jgi:hypothetical protein
LQEPAISKQASRLPSEPSSPAEQKSETAGKADTAKEERKVIFDRRIAQRTLGMLGSQKWVLMVVNFVAAAGVGISMPLQVPPHPRTARPPARVRAPTAHKPLLVNHTRQPSARSEHRTLTYVLSFHDGRTLSRD